LDNNVIIIIFTSIIAGAMKLVIGAVANDIQSSFFTKDVISVLSRGFDNEKFFD